MYGMEGSDQSVMAYLSISRVHGKSMSNVAIVKVKSDLHSVTPLIHRSIDKSSPFQPRHLNPIRSPRIMNPAASLDIFGRYGRPLLMLPSVVIENGSRGCRAAEGAFGNVSHRVGGNIG